MVNDVDKYRAEDEKQRERVSAKNSLESYCFNMKQTVEDDKLKDKISEAERKTVLNTFSEAIRWLDSNQLAEKEEFEHKLKDVEAACKPIVTKLYAGGGTMPDGSSSSSMQARAVVQPVVLLSKKLIKFFKY